MLKRFIVVCRRILKTQPPIPQYLSSDVADFISKLLVKDPRQRLGGGEADAEELKQHPFFKVSIFCCVITVSVISFY